MNVAARVSGLFLVALGGLVAGCSAETSAAASAEQAITEATLLTSALDPDFQIALSIPTRERIAATVSRHGEVFNASCKIAGQVEPGFAEAVFSCTAWAFVFEIAYRPGDSFEIRNTSGSGTFTLGDPQGPLALASKARNPASDAIGLASRVIQANESLLGQAILSPEVHFPTPVSGIRFHLDGTNTVSSILRLGDAGQAYAFGAPLRDASGSFSDAGEISAALHAAIQ